MARPFEKAITGFNHNIKHGGQVYHVQTEDSGVNNPHIITHLFIGGNILASKKTSYAHLAQSPQLAERVREMMEEQHKQMLRNLVAGVYDNLENAQARHYQPGQIQDTQTPAAPRAPIPLTQVAAAPLPPEVAAARALQEQPRPRTEGSETIFGEDLISDKSLDEVILSYLANGDD